VHVLPHLLLLARVLLNLHPLHPVRVLLNQHLQLLVPALLSLHPLHPVHVLPHPPLLARVLLSLRLRVLLSLAPVRSSPLLRFPQRLRHLFLLPLPAMNLRRELLTGLLQGCMPQIGRSTGR
jgi:hypothetical protein